MYQEKGNASCCFDRLIVIGKNIIGMMDIYTVNVSVE